MDSNCGRPARWRRLLLLSAPCSCKWPSARTRASWPCRPRSSGRCRPIRPPRYDAVRELCLGKRGPSHQCATGPAFARLHKNAATRVLPKEFALDRKKKASAVVAAATTAPAPAPAPAATSPTAAKRTAAEATGPAPASPPRRRKQQTFVVRSAASERGCGRLWMVTNAIGARHGPVNSSRRRLRPRRAARRPWTRTPRRTPCLWCTSGRDAPWRPHESA